MKGISVGRLTAAAALSTWILILPALAADTDRFDQIFKRLDVNGDGKVTPEEFTLEKIAVFTWLDTNQDNALEIEETKLSVKQFRAIDTNGDEKISGIEFIESKFADFSYFDTNGKGVITAEELRQGWSAVEMQASKTDDRRPR